MPRVQQSRCGRFVIWLQDVQSQFPLVFEGLKVTSCLAPTEALKRGCLTYRHNTLRVEEFGVARSGGVWVAIGETGGRCGVASSGLARGTKKVLCSSAAMHEKALFKVNTCSLCTDITEPVTQCCELDGSNSPHCSHPTLGREQPQCSVCCQSRPDFELTVSNRLLSFRLAGLSATDGR